MLSAAYGHKGLPRSVNGVPLRVLPQHRWYFAPQYDAPVAAFFRARLRPGDVSINVGANLGVYALQFAKWTAPGGRVFAFEPNPDTARVLQTHIHMNRLEQWVSVVQRAVADQPGTATFHVAGLDGMSRLGVPNPLVADKTVAITVEVESLDAFCCHERILPNAIMIDVEGFESAVLAGARGLYANHRQLLTVVEMHPDDWRAAGSDRRSFEKLLAELRVRLVPLSGQSDPLGEYGHVYLEPLAG
jgi:FkbM family methyltransferase